MTYDGEHDAVIDQALWDKVHAIRATSPRLRANRTLVLENGRRQKDEIKSALSFAPEMIEQLAGLPAGYLASGHIADFEPTLK